MMIVNMWYIFLILYVSYLILGPHWESKLIEKKPMLIVDSVRELFRRSIFISYVSLLYTAWFLYNPSYATAVNAIILSAGATYGFYTKYGPEKPFPMHIILNVFLLFASMPVPRLSNRVDGVSHDFLSTHAECVVSSGLIECVI
jgi:hypothetical protein